jgi:crossover junction endodeoxyribonuclease RuvC
MRILGVDPGGCGALALLDGASLERVADMPVFQVTRGKGVKRDLDVHGLVRLLDDWKPEACFFEQVGGMEGDSPSSAFTFGRIAGAAEALIKQSGARFEFVTPFVWKRAMGLVGTAKDDSRAKATNLWPMFAPVFALKKHDGRAESALLAEYGRLTMHQKGLSVLKGDIFT